MEKVIYLLLIGTLLLTGFSSVLATGLDVRDEIDDKTVEPSNFEISEIKLTEEEYAGIYNWCENIQDNNLKAELRRALDDTISSELVLYIKELEERLSQMENSPNEEDLSALGVLPAFPIIRCKWTVYDGGEAERTIHFWIFGWGRHELTWDTLDDHDGDGTWDLGPGTPWHYEWTALLFPLRHYDDWCYWDGYPGQAKVKLMYSVDGNSDTKIFTEPEDESDTVPKAPNMLLNEFKTFLYKLIRSPKIIRLFNNIW